MFENMYGPTWMTVERKFWWNWYDQAYIFGRTAKDRIRLNKIMGKIMRNICFGPVQRAALRVRECVIFEYDGVFRKWPGEKPVFIPYVS